MTLDLTIDVFDAPTREIIAWSGTPIPAETKMPLFQALMQPFVQGRQDERLTPKEKEFRYGIMKKFHAAQESGKVELDEAEFLLLRSTVDQHYKTIFHGRILEILDAAQAPAGKS